MRVKLLDFDAILLDISYTEAMRYSAAGKGDPKMKAIAEDLLRELRSEASLRACYTEVPIEPCSCGVNIGGIISDSPALQKSLEGCKSAVLFAATIGTGADRLIARYSKLLPSRAVILGGLGSAMIESWCDLVCDRIAEEYMKIGKCTKPRFSPGYGGFPLEAQRDIERLLDTRRRIGLYFTDSFMMIPEKSVTAVMGIFDNKGI